MVIKGKSFKPPAWGVPAVKAQTSAWARTQGRSVLGSRTLLGGQNLAQGAASGSAGLMDSLLIPAVFLALLVVTCL